MIHDLSKALRAILKEAQGPPLSEAYISFERPGESFKPQDQPTVNLFLYDIRENTTLRSNDLAVERRNGEVVTERAPLRVACSYLITTWSTEHGEIGLLQEHQLLGQVLQIFASHETIPRPFLTGALVSQAALPPLVTAMIDPQKNFSEFWTALGNRLRPSITLTATIAVSVDEPEIAPLVLSSRTTLIPPLLEREIPITRDGNKWPKSTAESEPALRGQLTDQQGEPLADASILLPQLNSGALTDAEGRFEISGLKAGKWTARVTYDGASRDYLIRVPSNPCDLRWEGP